VDDVSELEVPAKIELPRLPLILTLKWRYALFETFCCQHGLSPLFFRIIQPAMGLLSLLEYFFSLLLLSLVYSVHRLSMLLFVQSSCYCPYPQFHD
jgi:hypothetical protein